MRKLSEALKDIPITYAYCPYCKEYFIDDTAFYGVLKCPNKHSNRFGEVHPAIALIRNIPLPEGVE